MAQIRNIKGGKELQAMLNSLPVKIERNILRSALRQGANVLRDEARANVNDVSGDLSRSIKTKVRAKRGEVTATVVAGDDKAFYAHMVEFGTDAHVITAGEKGVLDVPGHATATVNHPGAQAAPYMRPAMDTKTSQAIQAVGEQIRKRLTKEGLNAPPGLEVDDV